MVHGERKRKENFIKEVTFELGLQEYLEFHQGAEGREGNIPGKVPSLTAVHGGGGEQIFSQNNSV